MLINQMFQSARRTLAVAALAATTLTGALAMWGPGLPQAQAARQCSIDADGSPGTMTFTLHVRQNTCDFRIHAYAKCGGLNPPYNGNEIQGTGDSVVSCWEAGGTVGRPYGYWYFDWRDGQWRRVGLG